MKSVLMAMLAGALLVSTFGCRDDRNDETGRGEREEHLDTTRGTRPNT